jgi:hypothetical protein
LGDYLKNLEYAQCIYITFFTSVQHINTDLFKLLFNLVSSLPAHTSSRRKLNDSEEIGRVLSFVCKINSERC